MLNISQDPRGIYPREVLNDTLQYPWYKYAYEAYEPRPEALAGLNSRDYGENIEILVFGGTWCGDTKNLLPKFYKTIDAMNSAPKTTLVLVDRDKRSGKTGKGLEKQYNLAYVPTFIVLENGTEKGRIVESVQTSIEEELAAIVLKD